MKKMFVLMALLFTASIAFGQKRVYCELVGSENILNSNVAVNVYFDGDAKTIVDAEGKVIKFKSMVNALNYMSERGWELVDTYVTVDWTLDLNSYHYVLSKELSEGESAQDGIKTISAEEKVKNSKKDKKK